MVHRAVVVLSFSAAFAGCASVRVPAAVPVQPSVIVFGQGALRVANPGSDWIVEDDIPMLGSGVPRFQLILHNTKTKSTIGVKAFPTSAASPVMMAHRMAAGMRSSVRPVPVTVSDVEFSIEDDSRAVFTYVYGGNPIQGSGKTVTRRLNGNISIAVIGTWSPGAADAEKTFDAVAFGISLISASP